MTPIIIQKEKPAFCQTLMHHTQTPAGSLETCNKYCSNPNLLQSGTGLQR
jgi:hypothetical protein